MAADFEKMKALRNIGSYAVLGLALGAMTFFGVCDPQQGGAILSGSAAKVANESVSPMEFRRVYNNAMQYVRNTGQDPSQMQLASLLLNQLVNERVAYIMAKENGFVVSDAEIKKELLKNENFFKDGKFSAERFEQILKYQGFTEATFTESMRRQLSLQKAEDFVATSFYVSKHNARWEYVLQETKFDVDYIKVDGNRMTVPVESKEIDAFVANKENEEKIKKYYETNRDDYETKARRKARHILVSFKGARNAAGDGANRSKEDAQKRANSLLEKVKASGANFAEIAKKETDEPSGKKSGGDLGWFDQKKMVKEFSEAAFAMKKGEISSVVESPFGFHVIKIEDAEEKKVTTLEQAQKDIAKILIQNQKRPDYAKTVADDLQANLNKKSSLDKKLKKYDLKWESTGEFSAETNYLPGLGGNQNVKDAVMALKSKGEVSKEPIKVGQTYYLLRMKKRTQPDLKKLDDKKTEELQLFSSMRLSRQIYSSMRQALFKDLEEKKKIYKNPEYLALDKPRNNNS